MSVSIVPVPMGCWQIADTIQGNLTIQCRITGAGSEIAIFAGERLLTLAKFKADQSKLFGEYLYGLRKAFGLLKTIDAPSFRSSVEPFYAPFNRAHALMLRYAGGVR